MLGERHYGTSRKYQHDTQRRYITSRCEKETEKKVKKKKNCAFPCSHRRPPSPPSRCLGEREAPLQGRERRPPQEERRLKEGQRWATNALGREREETHKGMKGGKRMMLGNRRLIGVDEEGEIKKCIF